MDMQYKKFLKIASVVIVVCVTGIPLLLFISSSATLGSRIENRISTDYNLVPQAKTYTVPRHIVQDTIQFLAMNQKQADSNSIKQMENNILNETIILIQAVKDNTLREKKFEQYIWHIIKKGIIEYYIKTRYHREHTPLKKTNVNAEEVSAFYKKHASIYNTLKLTNKQAHALITSIMVKKKQDQAYEQFMLTIINTFKLDHTITIGK